MFSGLGTELIGGLTDLVLPAACAGCGAERVPLRSGACGDCSAALEALVPYPTAPVPPPPGMPACSAVGPYAGPLRSALLAYKERGRTGRTDRDRPGPLDRSRDPHPSGGPHGAIGRTRGPTAACVRLAG